jgi:hypothetical protein
LASDVSIAGNEFKDEHPYQVSIKEVTLDVFVKGNELNKEQLNQVPLKLFAHKVFISVNVLSLLQLYQEFAKSETPLNLHVLTPPSIALTPNKLVHPSNASFMLVHVGLTFWFPH